jgi:hypothetical protein
MPKGNGPVDPDPLSFVPQGDNMASEFSGSWPARHAIHRWQDGKPLPRSAADLEESPQFLSMLGGRSRTPADLAKELEVQGVISSFNLDVHIPSLVTSQVIWGILGITYGQWCGWWNRRETVFGYIPVPVGDAKATNKATQWHREDLFRIRAAVSGGKRHRRERDEPVYPPETIRAFWEHINAAVCRMSPKRVEKISLVGWPIGVPKDYDALYREHRVYVERILNHYYKPSSSQSIEDVKGFIWLKLCEAQVIEKFVAKARYRRLPSTLTAAEAVEYLGITWDQWMVLMRKDLKWLQPEEGNSFTSSAIFSAKQVRNVEESGQFPIRDAIPASDMTKVFRGYLKQVIHNHFANYCRTRVRRFILDTPLPEGARVRGDGTVGSALEGDMTPWENCLEDPRELSPEACLDRPEVGSLEELNQDLSEQIAHINKSVPGHQDDVISLIADGYTLREAITKVQAKVRAKLKAHS